MKIGFKGSTIFIHINLSNAVLVQPARKRSEYSAFCQMADRAGADTLVIYLCDRGYASYNVFVHVIENSLAEIILENISNIQ